MGDLTFRTLREANMARLPQFRTRKGEIAHSQANGGDWSDAQWLQALVGEIGEYANLKKKVERGDLTLEEALPALGDELADVMIYLDLLAFRLGIDLGEAVRAKFNAVSDRVGSDVKIGSGTVCVIPDWDEVTVDVLTTSGGEKFPGMRRYWKNGEEVFRCANQTVIENEARVR